MPSFSKPLLLAACALAFSVADASPAVASGPVQIQTAGPTLALPSLRQDGHVGQDHVVFEIAGGPANGRAELLLDGQFARSANLTPDGGIYLAVSQLPTLAPGSHTAQVSTFDQQNTLSGTSATLSFVVEPVTPRLALTGDRYSIQATTTVEALGLDAAATDLRLDEFVDGVGWVTQASTAPAGQSSRLLLAAFVPGLHLLSAAQTVNGFANFSRGYGTYLHVVADAAPALTAPAPDALVAESMPRLRVEGALPQIASVPGRDGSAVGVRFYVDGTAVGDEPTDSAGAAGVFPPPLADGTHTVQAASVDDFGHVGVRSAARSFTVDTTAPVVPRLLSAAPVAGTSTLLVAGEPGTELRTVLDGRYEPGQTVGTDGRASVTLTDPLPAGAHELVFISLDAAGNYGISDTIRFTAAEAPAPPATAAPTGPAVAPRSALWGARVKGAVTARAAAQVTFTLSAATRVQVTLTRAGAKAPARRLSVAGKRGANTLRITRRSGHSTLPRGRYRVTLSGGGASASVSVTVR